MDNVFEYQVGLDQIKVTVYAANGVRATRRSRVRNEQLEAIKKLSEQTPPVTVDKDEFIFQVVDYPDMIGAADVLINGVKTEPDYKTVRDWPDEFTGKWLLATNNLNPHWLDPEYNKKKVTA